MQKIKSTTEFNKYIGVKESKKAIIDVGQYHDKDLRLVSPAITTDFYRISIKYDFHDPEEIKELNPEFHPDAMMFFSSPNQVLSWEVEKMWTGYYIQIEKNVIEANKHLHFNFLEYGYHEGLFLKEAEEKQISMLFQLLYNEYNSEQIKEDVLLSYCYLIFSYIGHFYKRQFDTKKEKHDAITSQFIQLLRQYYSKEEQYKNGMPNVQFFADKLNITASYLGDTVKTTTGKSPIEHIHHQIVIEAKHLIDKNIHSNTEIAFHLGFEYANYFSRLFKKITGISPTEYRQR